MKQYSLRICKIIAILVFFSLSCGVSPVSARFLSMTNITSGDTIYIGEQNLDLSALRTLGTVTPIVSLKQFENDNPTGLLLQEIPISSDGSFSISESVWGGLHDGKYYAWNGTAITNNWVYIAKISIDLELWPSGSMQSPPNSWNYFIGQNFHFEGPFQAIKRIRTQSQSQIAGAINYDYMNYDSQGSLVRNAPGSYSVEITQPNGVKTFAVGSTNFRNLVNIPSQSSGSVVMPNQNFSGFATGQYSVQGKFEGPTFSQSTVPVSNVINFNIVDKTVVINFYDSPISKGDNFEVYVFGLNNHEYYFYIKKFDNISQTQYPLIGNNQVGVDTSESARMLIKNNQYSNEEFSNYPQTGAIITSDTEGMRKIRISTSSLTFGTTYQIKVFDPQDTNQNGILSVSITPINTISMTPTATSTTNVAITTTASTTAIKTSKTTVQTTVTTIVPTTTPIASYSTPSLSITPNKKSNIKVPTPWPSDTPTQAAPIGIEIGILALGLAGLFQTLKR